MFIHPRSGASFANRISGDLMLENNLLYQYFVERGQLNIVRFI